MRKVKIRPKWLRLTEEINALDYLEKASYYIRETEVDVYAWKWVILALFGALYGFAICACKGSSPDWVTYETKPFLYRSSIDNQVQKAINSVIIQTDLLLCSLSSQ